MSFNSVQSLQAELVRARAYVQQIRSELERLQDHDYNDDGSDPGNCSVCHFYHGNPAPVDPYIGYVNPE